MLDQYGRALENYPVTILYIGTTKVQKTKSCLKVTISTFSTNEEGINNLNSNVFSVNDHITDRVLQEDTDEV